MGFPPPPGAWHLFPVMKKTITITLESGQKIPCPSQTLVGELLHEPADPVTGLPYLGALD